MGFSEFSLNDYSNSTPIPSLEGKQGLAYLCKKNSEASEGMHPAANAQAIPEYRALQKALWFPDISLYDAKKLLEEEEYWQKQENRDRYPGFKWF